ncbi:MAG TPA: hypothetical protein VKI61_14885, partial [Chitinophagaceae bacterium]|nr:hypothetical protein [Chitinophagaceae bacterium]
AIRIYRMVEVFLKPMLKYKDDNKKQVLFSLFGKRIPEISREKLRRIVRQDHSILILHTKGK